MEAWYKKSYFRNLVDMHIPNGEGHLEHFDAQAYAECMKTAGVDKAYVACSNCLGLCLYPSRFGIRHEITQKRDVFGETVAALRQRGIGVVGYINSWGTEVAKAHPEWEVRTPKGWAMGDKTRLGYCCPNSPYADLFYSRVNEVVSGYDIDGLWVDMVGFYAPVCGCKYCREKYKAQTGLELPAVVDWEDESFVRYIKFKKDSLAEYVRGIVAAARRAKPDISISIQCATWANPMFSGLSNDFFSQMDYVSGDFYSDRNKTDVVCRLLRNLSEQQPFEYMISRAPDLSYHTAIKDKSEILLQAYTSFLCGGSFLFIDAIDPDGRMNGEFYRMMREVKTQLEPFFKTIDYDAKILRDVAVYINFDSYASRAVNGKEISELCKDTVIPERLNRINAAFMRAHIDYDILTPKNLDELSGYKVIVVPDLYRMSPEECAKLRDYVAGGGRLYISGEASALSVDATNKNKFMLEDVMGVTHKEFVDRKPVYMAPTSEGQHLFGCFNADYPAMVKTAVPVVEVCSDSAQVLATITYPLTDARDRERYSSALSNPPVERTQHPALVYHPYGKGSCLYSAAPLEQSLAVCDYDVFANMIKSLLDEVGGITLACDESEYLEHVVRHNPERKHYTVSLLNYQTVKKIVPLHDISFALRLDVQPKNVYSNLGTAVSYRVENGTVSINLAKLDIYDVIYIEY